MKEKLRLVQNLLEKRRIRHKEHRFVVEGPHLVEEAQELIDFVIYSEELPILKKLREKGIECLKISRQQFSKLSEVETPQGILAVVKEKTFEMKDLLASNKPLIVFCVELQDPGNLGTIIRTADAVGATGVILSKGTVDLYNAKVIRSSMGSIFHLPIIQVDDINETIQYFKQRKIKIVATEVGAGKDYFTVDLKAPALVLVGNEGAGLPKEVIELADEVVKIPMPGRAESLNAAISAAVLLYEALRQRRTV